MPRCSKASRQAPNNLIFASLMAWFQHIKRSRILKASLFATGLSGIVAEYVLSTLATYYLGDAVFQWTMILSVMLFSMGLGSRISRYFTRHILETFIVTEFLLSILTSTCALTTYVLMAYTEHIGWLIYGFSILIGLLIGMEIPMATRLNEEHESLRTNIAGVMENDYFGSLIGGVFFAFIGLPYLGLTYTPFVLGGINFVVALALFATLGSGVQQRFTWPLRGMATLVFGLILAGVLLSEPIVRYGEQARYQDKVVFSKQTRYQKITVTQWKDHHWLYLNTSKQLCTFDEWLYHEPLVHPVMKLSPHPEEVLIVGAGDGCAIREVLKYPGVDSIILVDLDPEMTDIGANHPILRTLNQDAYHAPKVRVINGDAFNYLADTDRYFDVIIADFPDPRTIELNRLYTLEFYKLCRKRLRPAGVMITQAASPYYTTRAFKTIDATMAAAGFATIPIHNHVYTFGEWGWVIGAKAIPKAELKPRLQAMRFDDLDTRWISNEAMTMMTSFGGDLVPVDSVEVNAIHHPVLYKYYHEGAWKVVY
ncbi:MAG: polyamine aminopropyltransferase [Bacteroidota bacterium]